MSNYSTFSKDTLHEVGDIVFDVKQPYGNSWFLCDGSVISQSLYPKLFSQVGLIKNVLSFPGYTTISTTDVIRALTYGNGVYVAAGDGGVLATSTNEKTWTARTSGTISTINALTYGNGVYVYAGGGGVLATSTDAITWTARTSGTTSVIYALTYGNERFLYAGQNRAARYSTNGTTWTSVTLPSSGDNWGSGNDVLCATYGTVFVVATAQGTLATSTNAITWTTRVSGTGNSINALIYGNGLYVYAGGGGVLATSTDAITWTARTTGTASNIYALTYNQDYNLYIFGGSGGVVGTSTDAITWNVTTPTTNILRSMYENIVGGTSYLAYANTYTYDAETHFVIPTINVQSYISITSSSGVKANTYIKHS